MKWIIASVMSLSLVAWGQTDGPRCNNLGYFDLSQSGMLKILNHAMTYHGNVIAQQLAKPISLRSLETDRCTPLSIRQLDTLDPQGDEPNAVEVEICEIQFVNLQRLEQIVPQFKALNPNRYELSFFLPNDLLVEAKGYACAPNCEFPKYRREIQGLQGRLSDKPGATVRLVIDILDGSRGLDRWLHLSVVESSIDLPTGGFNLFYRSFTEAEQASIVKSMVASAARWAQAETPKYRNPLFQDPMLSEVPVGSAFQACLDPSKMMTDSCLGVQQLPEVTKARQLEEARVFNMPSAGFYRALKQGLLEINGATMSAATIEGISDGLRSTAPKMEEDLNEILFKMVDRHRVEIREALTSRISVVRPDELLVVGQLHAAAKRRPHERWRALREDLSSLSHTRFIKEIERLEKSILKDGDADKAFNLIAQMEASADRYFYLEELAPGLREYRSHLYEYYVDFISDLQAQLELRLERSSLRRTFRRSLLASQQRMAARQAKAREQLLRVDQLQQKIEQQDLPDSMKFPVELISEKIDVYGGVSRWGVFTSLLDCSDQQPEPPRPELDDSYHVATGLSLESLNRYILRLFESGELSQVCLNYASAEDCGTQLDAEAVPKMSYVPPAQSCPTDVPYGLSRNQAFNCFGYFEIDASRLTARQRVLFFHVSGEFKVKAKLLPVVCEDQPSDLCFIADLDTDGDGLFSEILERIARLVGSESDFRTALDQAALDVGDLITQQMPVPSDGVRLPPEFRMNKLVIGPFGLKANWVIQDPNQDEVTTPKVDSGETLP